MSAGAVERLSQRLAAVDWPALGAALHLHGSAVIPQLLAPQDCRALAALYAQDAPFRSRVVMQRHGFGSGEYKYFAAPLPDLVASLRSSVYARLAPRFPTAHADFVARCHAAGQWRPTPLLLQYQAGDDNCLHQDLYGEHVFPLQMVVLLAQPGQDFTGGELVLTEQRPRMQSRVDVLPLCQGDAVVFAVQQRPVAGTRGSHRVRMRHGVSRICSGARHALGIILHDAA